MCSLLAMSGLLSLASISLAQTFTPKNWTDVDSEPSAQAIQVAMMTGPNNNAVNVAQVLPLTQDAKGDPPIYGPALLLTAKDQLSVRSGQIVIISCDPEAWPGFETLSNALTTAQNQNVSAIIMYSSYSDTCDLTSNNNGFTDYYASKSVEDTTTMLWRFKPTLQGAVTINAVIGPPDPHNNTSSGDSSSAQSDGGPPPSTTVAMIILYSVTGVITALFLVVIITGAVRAHRHPERYGPQAMFGRTRQSRARGLARAMLDSLPIVKVGDREQEATKTSDVELAATGAGMENGGIASSQAKEPTSDSENAQSSSAATESEIQKSSDSPSNDHGIAAAAAGSSNASPGNNTLGCSICTEDFVVGEDQRVLPCDHRFHPACVDPWLLNISGTCPLCRIDLNPPNDQTPAGGGDDISHENTRYIRHNPIAPPTVMTEADMIREQQTRGNRTFTNSTLLAIVGLTRPNPANREEQRRAFEAYAAWQEQQREMGRQETRARGEMSEEQNSRLRRTMRNVFRVRTRRTGTMSSSDDRPLAESSAMATAEPTGHDSSGNTAPHTEDNAQAEDAAPSTEKSTAADSTIEPRQADASSSSQQH